VHCPAVRRMVIDLSYPSGLEFFTFCYLSNGQQILSHVVLPLEGGFLCLNLLMSNFEPRARPALADVKRVALLEDTVGCQFCVLRNVPCSCPPELYFRSHPPADRHVHSWEHWVHEFAKLRNRVSESHITVQTLDGNQTMRNSMMSRVATLRERDPGASFLRALRQRYLSSVLPAGFRVSTSLLHLVPSNRSDVHVQKSSSILLLEGCGSNATPLDSESREDAVCADDHSIRVSKGTSKRKQTCSDGDERLFVCEHCQQTFNRRHDLLRHHKGKHLGERPHVCDICGAMFSQKAHLITHTKLVHLRSSQVLCAECGKHFGTRSNMRKHSRNVHGVIVP